MSVLQTGRIKLIIKDRDLTLIALSDLLLAHQDRRTTTQLFQGRRWIQGSELSKWYL